MPFLSGVGLIASKDVGLFEAFSYPWPPSPTFYKLLEIERRDYPCFPERAGNLRCSAVMLQKVHVLSRLQRCVAWHVSCGDGYIVFYVMEHQEGMWGQSSQ